MPFKHPRFLSLPSSLMSFRPFSASKKAPSQARLKDPGTRSVAITCLHIGSSPTGAAAVSVTPSPVPTQRVSWKQRFKGSWRKRSEKAALIMTDHIPHSPASASDDALHTPSEDVCPTQSLSQSVASPTVEPESATPSDTTASSIPPLQVACLSLDPAEAQLADHFDHGFVHQPSETHSLHDLLCSVQPTVVTEHVEDEDQRDFTERDNDALRDYILVKTNVVLTSTCPEAAPHIVITPPYETIDDYYIPWLNRLDYHSFNPSLLAVPLFHQPRLAFMPYLDEQCYWPVAMQGASMSHGIPRRVFCGSRFNQLMDKTQVERLTMNDLITTLQRHRMKSLAIETSEQAKIWSERYTDAGYLESFEKPFQWTDPAEPLLKYANCAGVILFDSPRPFSVPHIMICTPPAQDPQVALSTATNDPQDGGFGRYLVVPSRMVSFVNMSPFHCPGPQPFSDDTDDSPPTSPEPSTPIDLDEDSGYHPWDHSILDVDEDDDVIYSSRVVETSYQNSGGHEYSWECPQKETDEHISTRKPIFFMDDEEEDDLPPLDDWYLSVASRNGIQINC